MCHEAASQAMLRPRQSLHKAGPGSAHRKSGGLSVWAVNAAHEGKENVEMRTGDTVPLSLGGGTQTLAQRDVDHELHAEYAMSGCSTMGCPIAKEAQVTPNTQGMFTDSSHYATSPI